MLLRPPSKLLHTGLSPCCAPSFLLLLLVRNTAASCDGCAGCCREGDQYKGSGVNVLTLILGLTFAVPLIGLAFAYFSYGNLWTGQWGVIPY